MTLFEKYVEFIVSNENSVVTLLIGNSRDKTSVEGFDKNNLTKLSEIEVAIEKFPIMDYIDLDRAANAIARKTFRGRANKIIVGETESLLIYGKDEAYGHDYSDQGIVNPGLDRSITSFDGVPYALENFNDYFLILNSNQIHNHRSF
jgi:hypothetical protein